MPDFSRIVIVGVGLIGGSIAKAARQRGLGREVVGLVRSEKSADRARQADVVDSVTTDPAEAAGNADFVIICTPVSSVVASLRKLLPSLPSGAIVTDAGSTKASIVQEAEQLLANHNQGVRFVGSHPLAGDHRTGPEAARADLLQDKTVIVTPTDQTDPAALQAVIGFWEQLGARTTPKTPSEHDALVAETSHLPHLLASVLAAKISDDGHGLVASGWRDTTRVASGDPALWVDIFKENAKEVRMAAEHFRRRLDDMINCFDREDWDEIEAVLTTGKQRRDAAEDLLRANEADARR